MNAEEPAILRAYRATGGLKLHSVGTIYFAQRGPYVKIGISRNPARRIQHLRYGGCVAPADADYSQPVTLLLEIPGSTRADELAMQERFRVWHVIGEWFRYDDALSKALDELAIETAGSEVS